MLTKPIFCHFFSSQGDSPHRIPLGIAQLIRKLKVIIDPSDPADHPCMSSSQLCLKRAESSASAELSVFSLIFQFS
jgi:hypothetical protein